MIELKPTCKAVKISFTRGAQRCCKPELHAYEHVSEDGEVWES